MPMGLSCCAIEFMAVACSRYDLSRFGSEVTRFSPRQADVMIVAGTVTYKMALAVRRIWDQMPEPKWCICLLYTSTAIPSLNREDGIFMRSLEIMQ